MNLNTAPTKGNLMTLKNSLALAKQGYELMDKKRNILIAELMGLINEAENIQGEIDTTFKEAYKALQEASVELGINYVNDVAQAMPIQDNITIKTRSIMGTEIPLAEAGEYKTVPTFAFYSTRESLDKVKQAFDKVRELTIRLSSVENSAYRLAANIKKTQKRANALQNITIPTYAGLCTSIQNALEEKEREEFTRLKVIKATKLKKEGKG